MTTHAQPSAITRADVVKMGQTRPPWEFIPLAYLALAQYPQDCDVELLLVGALSKLHLRTAAREHLDRLRSNDESAEQVAKFDAALRSMRDDRVTASDLEQTLKTNLDALAERGADLAPHLDAWRARIGESELFTTNDGNIVKRQLADQRWIAFRPDRQQAEAAALPHLASDEGARKSYVLEGIDPPWLLRRVWETTPQDDGFSPHITIAQRDPVELMDGLCLADLTDIIADPRTQWFVGEQAGAHFREILGRNLGLVVETCHLRMRNVARPIEPSISRIVNDVTKEQREVHEELGSRVRAMYEHRDPMWWLDRYRSGESLRILIPVSRFSTFLRHSADDLVDALRRAGHEGRTVTEPDAHSHLTTPAYYRAVLEFEPDMVIAFNFARCHMNEAVPNNIPFVTWVQDRLPRLFDPDVGASMRALDFVVGHKYKELYEQFGYPVERMTEWPVPVNQHKLAGRRLSDSQLDPYRCELAYVSHRSEPPHIMHARLRLMAQDDDRLGQTLDDLFEQLKLICRDVSQRGIVNLYDEALMDCLAAQGVTDPHPRLVETIRTNYISPMTEQLVRHETLTWAIEICQRRGWRLHIYGNGWDKIDEYRNCARPALEHGTQLRAAYQAAITHLHSSARTNLHQRTLEGFSAGTLMLCRFIHAEATRYYRSHERAMTRFARPMYSHPEARWTVWDARAYPPITEARDLMERLGIWRFTKRHLIALSRGRQEILAKTPAASRETSIFAHLAHTEQWLFRNADELEDRLEWAIAYPDGRQDLIDDNRKRIRGVWTYDAFAHDLFSMVEQGLADSVR
ncbi:MAG: hypothetical protein KAS72_10005 [Phycisphaerales bacterium]|nr:hypothetical protein [Phycisphaerales bacterium]